MTNDPSPRSQRLSVAPQTAQMIAGTAVLLLDQFCQHQPIGSRVLVGDSCYTIVENGRNLDILFRGDSMRAPTTILQLRTQVQTDGKTTSVISTNLSSQDVERFARINQRLAQDLQHQRYSSIMTPAIPDSDVAIE